MIHVLEMPIGAPPRWPLREQLIALEVLADDL